MNWNLNWKSALMLSLACGASACAAGASVAEAPLMTDAAGAQVVSLSMTTPRADAAAIRLRDGRVLICGGTANGNVGGVLASAELYDSSAHTFTPTGNMSVPRMGQTITMLQDGRVLVAGGVQNVGFRSELSSAEIYDPSSGSFSITGSMSIPREGHTATLLRDGRVLIAGGSDNGTHTVDSAETYDPGAGTFTRVGRLSQPREAHTATLLLSGKVLIAGGGRGDMPGGYISYNTAELFDPAVGQFNAVRSRMVNDRIGAAATLLNDGRVLIVGGKSGKVMMSGVSLAFMTPLNTAEIFDPEANLFTPTGNMGAAHYLATATLLNNGNVLVVGGWVMQGPTVVGMKEADVYQTEMSMFSQVPPTNVARLQNTATLLNNGQVLIAGGIDGTSNITPSVEFYSSLTHRFHLVPEGGPAPMPQQQ